MRIKTLYREEASVLLAQGPRETDRAHFELTIQEGEIEGGEALETGEEGSGVLADYLTLNEGGKGVTSSGIGFVIEEGVPAPRIDNFNRLFVTYHNGSGELRARSFDNRSCIPMDVEQADGLPAQRLECFETSFLGAAEFVSLKVGDWNGDGRIDMAYVVDDPILGRQTYLFQNKPIHEIAPEGASQLWKVYDGLLADGVELDAHFIGRMRALGAKMVELMKEGEDAIVDDIMRKIDYAMGLGHSVEYSFKLDFLTALLDVFELSGGDLRIVADVGIKRDELLFHNLRLMRLAGMFAKARDKDSTGSLKEAYLVNMMSGLYWYSIAGMTPYADAEYEALVRSIASMGNGMTEEQLAGIHAAMWFGFIRPHDGQGTTPVGLASQIDQAMSAPDAKGRYAALYDLFRGDLDLDADFLVKYSPFITASNLPTLEDLRIADAAIGSEDALRLYQKFNITRFARYHPSVLRHLVDMAKDPDHMRDRPLVMIVTAQFDGTGMFHWGRRFEYDPRVRVVAVEVGSVPELDFAIRDLAKKYGAPDSVMITAHGDPSYMMMGYLSPDEARSSSTGFLMAEERSVGHKVSLLSVDHHYDFLSKNLGGVFGSARPQIVLNSCSTGKERPDGRLNVAQMFANVFQTEVYAPEAVEGLLKLDVDVDANGRARLNPLFAEVRDGPIGLNDGGRRFVPQPYGMVTRRGLSRRQRDAVASSGEALPGSDRIPDLGKKEGRSRAREFFRGIFGW
ncbi:MAG: hypothetical protein JXA24_04550 [Proteobacteria bacterium]|nr:hypothetical protein [Pseudomonadota bacterium]